MARRRTEPRWLPRVVVDAIHNDQIREHGGLPAVRDARVEIRIPDRARVLLTVLSYAYCTGVYESEEVSELCGTDATLRQICGEEVPSTRMLDRFRRENRGLLKWVLVQILKRALRARYNLNTSMLPAGLKQHLVDLATERLDLARHMDRAGEGA